MSFFSIDEDKCKRDGICAMECPVQIIRMPGNDALPRLIDNGEEFCINCGHCVAVCPHGALALGTMNPEQCQSLNRSLVPGYEQVDHLLRGRRSIRCYAGKPLPGETVESLIQTARYAPSGHNSEPVEWLVIQGHERLQELAGLVVDWMRVVGLAGLEIFHTFHMDRVIAAWEAGQDRVLRNAPCLVAAHAPTDLPPAQAACTIALTYLELAAFARGLGACWAGYFNAAASAYDPLKKELALPPGHQTFGAMMLGHPKFAYHRIPLRKDPKITWK